uniref:ZP domain-containing protein n=1 Tax=Ciona savignyi TaxID=51511 RepID=H2Z8V4_CIOSA
MKVDDICADIPDCTNNSTICDNATSTCEETPGSYRCNCREGYTKSPGATPHAPCVNINECAASSPVCSAGSQCTDSEGSFTCSCLPGHVRISSTVCSINATRCEHINCTTEGSVCRENGNNAVTCECPSNKAKKQNKCLPRYKFVQRLVQTFLPDYNNLNSPASLQLINDFRAKMLQILRSLNASDIVVTGLQSGSVIVLYDLILNESPTGQPVSQEQALITISQAVASNQFNTSLFDGGPATSTSHLVSDNMCPKKNITQIDLQALQNHQYSSQMTCQPSLVAISIDYCNLTNAGLIPEHLVLAGPGQDPATVDPACKARLLSLPDGRITVTFLLFNILSCGYQSSMSENKLTLKYDVRNVRPNGGVVQRYYDACISFNCTFNRTVEVDSQNAINPKIAKVKVAGVSTAGKFDVSMNLFRDENCTMMFQGNPPTVFVEDYIFFKAALTNADAGIILQAPNCWATPTSNHDDTVRYNLIQEGCASPLDPGKIKVVKNYQTYYISGGVASFIWTNMTVQKIYIHCEVVVCVNSANNCTGPTCPSRKKRFVAAPNDPQRKLYSVGPIKIASACDEIEPGMCSQKCIVVNGKPRCACMEGFQLAEDLKTCVADVQYRVVRVREPSDNNFASINVVLFFILTI